VQQRPDGLILRSLSAGFEHDKASLPEFYRDVFVDAYGEEDELVGKWALDLLSHEHPTVTDDDVWVIVDPAQDDRIVSALLLIPQTWRYADIEIGVGRVELVATHKDYRGRGLVRDLMHALHERSAALGHDITVITGIPHFYRQFGYAMAIDLGTCGMIPFGAIPKLKDDQKPTYTLRLATEADIPDLICWNRHFAQRKLLSVVQTEEQLRFELNGRHPKSDAQGHYHIIVDQSQNPVGFLLTDKGTRRSAVRIHEFVVDENTSYMAVMDDVLRGMKTYALENHEETEPYYISFASDLYEIVEPLLGRMRTAKFEQTEYAWYVRVPDLPAFIQKIKPVLEARLEGSLAHCYTGKLHLEFYDKTGLLMKFEHGKIAEVKAERPGIDKDDAAFPYHSFLSVLFGHRSVRELEAVLPDLSVNRNSFALLNILFPRIPSGVTAALE
jgi:predicted acetyltransferase